MLSKISLSSVGLVVGGILTIIGFIAYATANATLNLAGLFYGVPILLGGLALKAAELKPIPFTQSTSPEVLALREKQATSTQNQLRKDVNRYRYGQEAHLDEALQRLGLSPTDEERPILTGIREIEVNGFYTLVMEFDSPFIAWEDWQKRQAKIEKFFGPDIQVDLIQPEEKKVEVFLIKTPPEKA